MVLWAAAVLQYLMGRGQQNRSQYSQIAQQNMAKHQQAAAQRGYGRAGQGGGAMAAGPGANLLQQAISYAMAPKQQATPATMGGWTSGRDASAASTSWPQQIIGPGFAKGAGSSPASTGIGMGANSFSSGFGPHSWGGGGVPYTTSGQMATAAPAASGASSNWLQSLMSYI